MKHFFLFTLFTSTAFGGNTPTTPNYMPVGLMELAAQVAELAIASKPSTQVAGTVSQKELTSTFPNPSTVAFEVLRKFPESHCQRRDPATLRCVEK